MGCFIRTLIIFVYFILALFIPSSNVCAYENYVQNTSQQILFSSESSTLVNNNKKEYCAIFKGRNQLELTNSSNKNNSFTIETADKFNSEFTISEDFIIKDFTYPIYISDNTFLNLKNTIYTRAP